MHPYMTQQLAAGRAADTMRRAEAARLGSLAMAAKSVDAPSKDGSAGSLLAVALRVRKWRSSRRSIAVPAPASRPRVDCCY